MIDKEDFNDIMKQYKDSGTAIIRDMLRKAALNKIIEDTEEIQKDLQAVRDNSLAADSEYQMFIYLDTTGVLSSVMGPTGDEYGAHVYVRNYSHDCINFIPRISGLPTNYQKIFIGEVHGHPKTIYEGRTVPGNEMSERDKGLADTTQTAIYAVEAQDGEIGDTGIIHRANPNRTITRHVGATRGENQQGTIFDIGVDALEIWAGSRTPIFVPKPLQH
jgi:hypothetical protein